MSKRVVFIANFIFVLLMASLLIGGQFVDCDIIQQLGYLIASGVICLAIFYGYKKLDISQNFDERKFLIFYFAILAFVQMVAVYSSSTSFGWDTGVVVQTANTIKGPNDMSFSNNYYSMYPNNLLLVYLYYYLSSIGDKSNIFRDLALYNIVFIDLAMYFVYRITNRLKDQNAAIAALIISTCIWGVFPWILVPYSDVISMPITTGLIYLGIKYYDAVTLKRRVIYVISFVILLFVGYEIKPTNVIVFIALSMVGVFLYMTFGIKPLLKHMGMVGAITVVLVIMTKVWSYYIYDVQSDLVLDREKAFPMEHFLVLGQYEYHNPNNGEVLYGTWNDEDVRFTSSFDTYGDRKSADKNRFIQRVKDRGSMDFIQFEIKKAIWVINDGTFYWNGEGNFADYEDMNDNFFEQLWYEDGKYIELYRWGANVLWKVILILICIPTNCGFRKNSTLNWGISLMRCTIVGIMMFLSLFEARSRYLILYLPIFTMMATMILAEMSGSKGYVDNKGVD